MRSVVIIGVSRGIGRELAEEHLRRGWEVIGTVRSGSPQPEGEHLTIETLETTDEAQLDSLLERLPPGIDRVIASAGVAGPTDPIGVVSTDDFMRTMEVNTLAPLRIVDRLAGRVSPDGMLAVVSTSQASIALNEDAAYETYRISKVGLNMGLKSIAVRRDDGRTCVAVNPGWVRTAIGSEHAALSVEESVPQVIDRLDELDGQGGMHFASYDGQTLPW